MASSAFNYIMKNYRKSFAIAAAFLISFGWNWYHAKRDPAWKFILIVIGAWAAVYFSYKIGKFLYKIIIRRLGFNDFLFWIGSSPSILILRRYAPSIAEFFWSHLFYSL